MHKRVRVFKNNLTYEYRNSPEVIKEGKRVLFHMWVELYEILILDPF